MLLHHNWKDARPILEQYADSDHPRAVLLLEILCKYYYHTSEDQELQYAKQGQALDSVQSFVLSTESGTDILQYLPQLKALADQGNAFDEYLYGAALAFSRENQDMPPSAEILQYLERSAEHGCDLASDLIADLYYRLDAKGPFEVFEESDSENDRTAFQWRQQAADWFQKAEEWNRKATVQGDD